jgi:hypothetical protein
VKLILALAGILVLAGCSSAEEPSPHPTAAPTSVPATSALVYYLVDQPKGLRLAREPHRVHQDAAKETVEAMIAGPDDPDYSSLWNPTSKVRSVESDGSVVNVDLDSAARAGAPGTAGAALMVQQLVYTVTEVLGHRLKVRLLVDGEEAGELWGAVSWDRPIGRSPAEDVRQVVQIDTPAEGAETRSPVHVSGDASAFEANVPWRVLDGNGRMVKAGHTSTAEGFVFSKYGVDITLDPGAYSIEILEDNPSAVDPELTRDTRQFTVH